MSPGKFLLLRLGYGSAIFGLGLENFPYQSQFFPLRIKKISLGHVKKYQSKRRPGLLFTAGQKYDCLRSGPIFTCPLLGHG